MDRSPRDVQVFREMFDAHLDPLQRFVCSYVGSWETAEEIVQDAFLQLWRRLRSSRAHAESMRDIRDMKAYLYTTARNRAINHLRHEQVKARHVEGHLAAALEAGHHSAVPDAEGLLLTAELAAALQRAIDELPARQREIIRLKWQGHATQDEIGQALGITGKTVSEHFRRAIDQLRWVLRGFINGT